MRRSQPFSVCVVNDVTEFLRVSSSLLSHPGSIPGGSVASDERRLCCVVLLCRWLNQTWSSPGDKVRLSQTKQRLVCLFFVFCFLIWTLTPHLSKALLSIFCQLSSSPADLCCRGYLLLLPPPLPGCDSSLSPPTDSQQQQQQQTRHLSSYQLTVPRPIGGRLRRDAEGRVPSQVGDESLCDRLTA